MRPEGTGFIVRTVAENVEAAKLEADIRFLIQVWNEIIRTKDKVGGPGAAPPATSTSSCAPPATSSPPTSRSSSSTTATSTSGSSASCSEQAPHLEKQIELYSGEEPIFDAYGIEQELKRASQRKVWLKSGGYIIIDQAEALTAIDVNSGRYVGKKNLEETITKINVEAAKEIVYQLRLRNIGGIIIIDFIDMDKPQNRDKVFKALQDALGRDKAKTNVLKISELGLVEMTRKRVRESVTRMMNEPCSYCDGKGHVKSRITVAYEIFREIRREAAHFPEPVLVVNCHPEVGAHPPERGARGAALPHGPLQQDHPGEAAAELPPGAVRHLRPAGPDRRRRGWWRRGRRRGRRRAEASPAATASAATGAVSAAAAGAVTGGAADAIATAAAAAGRRRAAAAASAAVASAAVASAAAASAAAASAAAASAAAASAAAASAAAASAAAASAAAANAAAASAAAASAAAASAAAASAAAASAAAASAAGTAMAVRGSARTSSRGRPRRGPRW